MGHNSELLTHRFVDQSIQIDSAVIVLLILPELTPQLQSAYASAGVECSVTASFLSGS